MLVTESATTANARTKKIVAASWSFCQLSRQFYVYAAEATEKKKFVVFETDWALCLFVCYSDVTCFGWFSS